MTQFPEWRDELLKMPLPDFVNVTVGVGEDHASRLVTISTTTVKAANQGYSLGARDMVLWETSKAVQRCMEEIARKRCEVAK